MTEPVVLGLDLGTQSVKAVLVACSTGRVCESVSVAYSDPEIPAALRGPGFTRSSYDPRRVTASVHSWLAALDLALLRLSPSRRRAVTAVSVSAQQHAAVWLTPAGAAALQQPANLRSDASLADVITPAMLSLQDVPIWMDSSTTSECGDIEKRLGGAVHVAQTTGSRCFERFTGPQILRIARLQPEVYAGTSAIRLVSAFVTSLFAGCLTSHDASDASGMNLMDVHTASWSQALMQAIGLADLPDKLGADIIPSATVVSPSVSVYCQQRYHLPARCRVVAGTGDNPSALTALGLARAGDVAVSLGTSDTLFALTPTAEPHVFGHVFRSPVSADLFMAMLVYSNGGVARAAARDALAADATWAVFDAALASTPPGCHRRCLIHASVPEISPPIQGLFRAGAWLMDKHEAPLQARAMVEHRALAMQRHARLLGLEPKRLFLTGGGAMSRPLLQVFADVFDVPVIVSSRQQAGLGAAYGAAVRAAGRFSFADVASDDDKEAVQDFIVRPDPAAVATYRSVTAPLYSSLEDCAISMTSRR